MVELFPAVDIFNENYLAWISEDRNIIVKIKKDGTGGLFFDREKLQLNISFKVNEKGHIAFLLPPKRLWLRKFIRSKVDKILYTDEYKNI